MHSEAESPKSKEKVSKKFEPKTRTQLYAMLALEDAVPEDDLNGSLLQSVFGFEDEIQHDEPETKAAIERARAESMKAAIESDDEASVE